METKLAKFEGEVADTGEIVGYASKFGTPDQGGDIVVKGAFSTSLAARLPKMLWQHRPDKPIGVWIEAKEDDTGLFVRGMIDLNVRSGAEAHSLLKSGAIEGLSIGYRTRDAQKRGNYRELKNVDLWEVSLVTFPMHTEASVQSVKNTENTAEMKRITEEALRDAGYSQKQAKHGASLLVKEVLGEAHTVTVEDVRQLVREIRA